MAKTIIQTIGPLYGEVVNGTVFGRPNGSIYVPSTNTIEIKLPSGFDEVLIVSRGFGKRFALRNDDGVISDADIAFNVNIVAQSQDIQSYIECHLADSDGVQIGTPRTSSAGLFNINTAYVGNPADDDTITNGEDYQIVAILYSSSGVPVATDTVNVTGWAE